jgi:hemerythrin
MKGFGPRPAPTGLDKTHKEAVMEIIKWQDIYEVHIEEIDSQHKKLVSLVNTLAEAMRSGRGKTVVGKVLKELVDYAAYHFETEEKCFLQHGYPEYEAHKQIHCDLTKRAMDMKKAFDQGKPLATTQVMLFLTEWLNKHIVEEDRKFGRYVDAAACPTKAL